MQVPYRGGGEAIHDLIAGTVQLGSLGTTPLIPYYKAGTLKLLAQSTASRSPALPDVPTFQEAGLKGLVLDQWTGVFVPAGTAPDIVKRLNTAVNAALADAKVRKSFLDAAPRTPAGGAAEQYAQTVRARTSDKLARLVKELISRSRNAAYWSSARRRRR